MEAHAGDAGFYSRFPHETDRRGLGGAETENRDGLAAVLGQVALPLSQPQQAADAGLPVDENRVETETRGRIGRLVRAGSGLFETPIV